ncbi:Y4yA family PLP-dependent enzyme [Rhodopirellula sp. MGV]|uniref:Y4yA family PLP-dependent enzyme n=1 Tax=Rhodopirellula sp. MGV TaxID=2023130 RepID=UPI000B95CF29|nr:Y4yA family PLP-dependent enzyme [Rhodopirellula sp. MGV]OYP38307.1 diaminopimelate decarboxylase [Rhodopirellula sp. MGV]PNY38571.1 Y4yA family PLP-dependent enzyme [Rhodopirellula baltica]
MLDAINDPRLFDWIDQYGSPLNLICVDPMSTNLDELQGVAASFNLDLGVFFARKANKCLAFVERAIEHKIGIDTAGEMELRQALDYGVSAEKLICTAAVKSDSLFTLCLRSGVTIAVDNDDELTAITSQAISLGIAAKVAIRLGRFQHQSKPLPTRFGFDASDFTLLDRIDRRMVDLVGFHFHLDGSDLHERVSAIEQTLVWVDEACRLGFRPQMIDIGGGFPVSYLQNESQWNCFWDELGRALLHQREPITYRNHGLGLLGVNGQVYGTRNTYPYFQPTQRVDWFRRLLATRLEGEVLADAISGRKLELRCEPGRGLLDGCGLTIARVEFCKPSGRDEHLVGLSMNSTQCRTTSDDFLVDPIVIRHPLSQSCEPVSGYFVGAYCTESELISLRKFDFPEGIGRGDLVVFPNTAGYLMHFVESRSHQFPLAKNLIWGDSVELDSIETQGMTERVK